MPHFSFIPERYEEGFIKIAAMNESDFALLLNGLSLMSLVSSTKTLALKISENTNLDGAEINDIFESIGSLISYAEDDQVSKDIVNDLVDIAISEDLIKDEDVEVFKQRVISLLKNQHLFYASKAQSLTTEFGSVYLSSKLVTDIRPVFGTKIEETPIGGIITHSLHIHYREHREGDHKDIYLSLDKEDISSLIEVLRRAQKKETSLKHIFDKSGMTNLND